jgi:molecular chaperone GrpE
MAGLRLVRERFLAGLKAHGITPIDAERCAFDPEHHEAVAHVPSDEHPAGHIIGEAQRGYRHGVQTLRASRVAVSSGEPGGQKEKAPPDETGEPEADAGEAEGDTDADV